MALRHELRRQGDFLFRWRSFLPLALLPLAILAGRESGFMEERWGDLVEDMWMYVCLAVSMLGLLTRVGVVGFAPPGTSGRNTAAGQRAETLNTTGLYATVRNPLYLGNFLIFAGFILAIKVWWFVLIASLIFVVYYERIILAEEAFLERRFGQAYADWARTTPVIIPGPWRWTKPPQPFSVRRVLRREYNGFYLIVVVFTLIEFLEDLLIEGESFAVWLVEDRFWPIFLVIGSVVFLTLRTLKRHTDVLRMSGH